MPSKNPSPPPPVAPIDWSSKLLIVLQALQKKLEANGGEGYNEVGLFRVGGNDTIVDNCMRTISTLTNQSDMLKAFTIEDLTTLAKKILKKIPGDTAFQDKFQKETSTITNIFKNSTTADKETELKSFHKALQNIFEKEPAFQELFYLLKEISLHSDINQMTVSNIAVTPLSQLVMPCFFNDVLFPLMQQVNLEATTRERLSTFFAENFKLLGDIQPVAVVAPTKFLSAYEQFIAEANKSTGTFLKKANSGELKALTKQVENENQHPEPLSKFPNSMEEIIRDAQEKHDKKLQDPKEIERLKAIEAENKHPKNK